MPPDELRDGRREVADWISDYLAGVGRLPRSGPGEARARSGMRFPRDCPRKGEPFQRIFRDFEELILPGVTHWNHPGFFAYFSITGSAPGVLGEMLASALNVNAMVWRSSPVGNRAGGAHPGPGCGISWAFPRPSTAPSTTRPRPPPSMPWRPPGRTKLPEAWEDGLSGAPRGRFYASEQAHASVDKAVITLGFGRSGIRKIPTDDGFPDGPGGAHEGPSKKIWRRGSNPLGWWRPWEPPPPPASIPSPTSAKIAREFDLWLHVDAAYGGPAAAVPGVQAPLHRVGERPTPSW